MWFKPRWEVVRVIHVHHPTERGWNLHCGYNYRRSDAQHRAAQLEQMTGQRHRVIDRKLAR